MSLVKSVLLPQELMCIWLMDKKMKGLEGAVNIYNSTEIQGIGRKLRRKVDAPVHLALKINAPFILTVNIPHK